MEVKIRESMKRHTTFRAGGEAEWFLLPETAEELAAVLRAIKKAGAAWYMIGYGSNLLVSDKGFPGAVISMERFRNLSVSENTIRAGAGGLLSKLAGEALKAGLSGLEFAAGIPGSLGGAVVMNAGAYGSEMKDVLKAVSVLSQEGEILELPCEELCLGYRKSCIGEKGFPVLEAEVSLEKGEPETIRARMEELAKQRREKQPLEFPSAGSTFKRPEGNFAGKLIEEAGLKGFSIGGAAVSEKHAGFVINKGGAAAADIYRLCREVRRRVYENSGVLLELEIRLLGEFEE